MSSSNAQYQNLSLEIQPSSFNNETLLLAPEELLLPGGVVKEHAVLIAKGVFAEIDTLNALAKRYPNVEPIHMSGHLMMPGFVDAHHHLSQSIGKSLVFGEPSEIFKRIWVPLEASLEPSLLYLSAKLAALEALRGGFTSVVDAGCRSAEDSGIIAEAAQEAGLRCVLGLICNDQAGAAKIASYDEILLNAEKHLERWQGNELIRPSLAVSIPEVASDRMLHAASSLSADAGVIFQTHANEHLQAVERSLVARDMRPIEHLDSARALGPQTLLAHTTLITPKEISLLRDSDTAVAYNPVASVWKGNAVAPALQMSELGIRIGLGTDGTRSDAFRLIDAAESSQRLAFGLSTGDSSCGGGWLWLKQATEGAADVAGLGGVTGSIDQGLAADFLLVDINVPEMTPSWDRQWELVRYANREQIKGVFTNGQLRLWEGWPLDWDAQALMLQVRNSALAVVANAPIHKVHPTSEQHYQQNNHLKSATPQWVAKRDHKHE